MTTYAVFIRDETTSPAELEVYGSKAQAAAEGHPLTRLAAYGAFEVLEGPQIEGAVILQFPSMDDAKSWYNSPLYQDALQHRLAAAKYRVFFIEGLNQVTPKEA
jgi:uncharacterized protein (DUF1330 family)